MSGFFRSASLFLILAALTSAPAAAQVAVTATLSASLGGRAKLTLSSSTVTFPDADPDSVPLISPATGPLTVTVKARASAGSTVSLTVAAVDDLRSGTFTIPVSTLTWTGAGAGFVNGTVSRAVAQTLGTWSGSGVNVGTQTYRFQNSWIYAPGTYTLVLYYTLTAP
jgi:hypothetical protein